MGDLTTTNNSLAEQPDSIPVPTSGKTLYIKPNTPGFNYRNVLNQALQYVSMGDIISKVKAGTQYVVQIPAELQEGFESGEFFMMQNQKTGKMWPSLMEVADNGRNQVVSPLPIAEQSIIQGNPFHDLSINYHNILMQQQMFQLTEMVEKTYRLVKRIEHGQMDDRIGHLEAGKNGMLLALSMPEGNERTMQINSSRQNLLVAQAQIGQVMQRRISEFEPLPKAAPMRFLKEMMHSGYLDERDRDVDEIQDYYDLYLQATKLIAVSYAISGDNKTAEETFKIGEQFLDGIDFKKVKSIGYGHPDLPEMFFDSPVEYMSTEKTMCLDEAKKYDYVAIEVSGEELLEALEDGREKAF